MNNNYTHYSSSDTQDLVYRVFTVYFVYIFIKRKIKVNFIHFLGLYNIEFKQDVSSLHACILICSNG